MKNITLFIIFFTSLALFFQTSCKKEFKDRYKYYPEDDTLAPVITKTVPVNNSVFAYGDDINIVANVTDLEKGTKAGKLKSITARIENLSDNNKLILNKSPNVDGLDGFTVIEKLNILFGSASIDCRLIISATDYADKNTQDTTLFKIQ